MGLSCGCPPGAHLPDLDIPECKESLGQIQKVIFQRVYKASGVLNTIADLTKKAALTALFSAADSTKLLITPYIQNPTTEPGAARTFGGGNQTLGGVELIIGREPTTFSGIMYETPQKVVKTLKQLMCEAELGVYLIDENGNIGALEDSSDEVKTYRPIPIGKFFVGDKKLGGFEEPDSNTIEWSFYPNWSDDLVVVKGTGMDYNPLTDLANASSAS